MGNPKYDNMAFLHDGKFLSDAISYLKKLNI
jgi:hypothetical protein